MANDYNQWIAINVDSEAKRAKIHNAMLAARFKARPSLITIIFLCVCLCVLIAGIVLLLFSKLLKFGILLTVIGLILFLIGGLWYRKKLGLTDLNTVKKELTMVGSNIEAIL